MKRIDIKTSFNCNNYCRFCIQGDKRSYKTSQTTDQLKKTLEDNCKDFDQVVFTGGEVTIRNDLIELVAFAKKCGYKSIQVQTNGRMFFYIDYCKKLIDAGVDSFGPSIHGSTKEMHESLTRAEGSFEQTVQGIINLKKLNQKIGTNTVITRTNYKDLPNIAKLLVNLGVKSYQFAFMHINYIIQKDIKLIEEIVPRYEEVKPYVEEGLQIGIDAGIVSKVEAFPFCTLNEKYYSCIAEQYTPYGFISEDGKPLIDFTKAKKETAKLKNNNCKKCKYYEKCEGPWRDYPTIFGFREFNPIIK